MIVWKVIEWGHWDIVRPGPVSPPDGIQVKDQIIKTLSCNLALSSLISHYQPTLCSSAKQWNVSVETGYITIQLTKRPTVELTDFYICWCCLYWIIKGQWWACNTKPLIDPGVQGNKVVMTPTFLLPLSPQLTIIVQFNHHHHLTFLQTWNLSYISDHSAFRYFIAVKFE